jgi:hypothetical protein
MVRARMKFFVRVTPHPPCHRRALAFMMMTIRRQRGRREGIMDELIARLVAKLGVDRDAAEKAVAVIFEFLRKEGPPDKVQALMSRLPGAEELMESQEGIDASGGGGFAMGGLMGAGTKMMAAGLSMGQVQGVTREVIAYAREQAGDDAIGEIVGAIPGLSQFI